MVALIVPCYNEAKRLQPQEFIKFLSAELQVVFVNDGSTDETFEFLNNNFANNSFVEILNLPSNQGKAEAVRQGLLHMQSISKYTTMQWWGYWDADLSTPLSEVSNFLAYSKNFAPSATAIFGSRVYKLGSIIKRSVIRHALGRAFTTLIANALKIEAYDTQCGAKLLKPALAKEVCKDPFISNWIFDVEILLRAGQQNVVEYPLRQWQDVKGSKVKIWKEVLRVLKDIYKIRKINF